MAAASGLRLTSYLQQPTAERNSWILKTWTIEMSAFLQSEQLYATYGIDESVKLTGDIKEHKPVISVIHYSVSVSWAKCVKSADSHACLSHGTVSET